VCLSQWHCFSVLRGGHKRVIACDRAIFNRWRAIFVPHCRRELHGFTGNTDLELDGSFLTSDTGHQ